MIKKVIQPLNAFNIFILSVVMFIFASCADINLQQTGYETAKQNCKEGRNYHDYQSCIDEVDKNYNKTNQ